MKFESQKLRDAANGQPCIRCGRQDETIVGAHYTGYRRLAYDGGTGIKVWDFLIAHLCFICHTYMDTVAKTLEKYEDEDERKVQARLHSEEFLHLVALTLARLFANGTLQVAGAREQTPKTLSKILPRRIAC